MRAEVGRIKGEVDAARVRRFDDLTDAGRTALGAGRSGEAAGAFGEAIRLRDDPQVRRLPGRSHRADLGSLWLLTRREDGDGSVDIKGLTEGLLFEGDGVTAARAARGDARVAKGAGGSYSLDAATDPGTIRIRWDEVGGAAASQLGIYRLGNEGLTLSWGEPGEGGRPRAFDPNRAEVEYYVRGKE